MSDRKRADLKAQTHDRLRKELLERHISSGAADVPAPPAGPSPAPEAERRPRKPSRIFHPRKAKQDWTYDQADVMALYDITRNTVRNWLKEGLRCVPGKPVLFRGRDLNQFHHDRQARARRECSVGEFLCFHCKKVASLIGRSAEMEWRSCRGGTMRWSCPLCGKPNETFQSRARVEALERASVKLTTDEADYCAARLHGEIVQIGPDSEGLHEHGERAAPACLSRASAACQGTQ